MRALKQEKTEYDVQAEKFLTDTKTEISFNYTGHRLYFDDDKEYRATFEVTLKRGDRSFSFDFGSSIVESWTINDFLATSWSRQSKQVSITPYMRYLAVQKALKTSQEYKDGRITVKKKVTQPSDYSVLACLGDDPGTHQDFCDSYGYDMDSIKGRDIYLAVQEQYSKLSRLYNEVELEALREIQ